MKKLRMVLDAWSERVDGGWRALPVKKQRKYALLLFAGYLLLTIGVTVKVWIDAGTGKEQSMGHIKNPVILKTQPGPGAGDSISTIIKSKLYEQ